MCFTDILFTAEQARDLQAEVDNQIDCHKSAVSITAGLHSLLYLLSTLWDLVEFPYHYGIDQGTVAKYLSIYW